MPHHAPSCAIIPTVPDPLVTHTLWMLLMIIINHESVTHTLALNSNLALTLTRSLTLTPTLSVTLSDSLSITLYIQSSGPTLGRFPHFHPFLRTSLRRFLSRAPIR